jgi:hypothetical protein
MALTPLTDSQAITIIVNDINSAPVLDPIGNQAVDELVTLAFTATASDSDIPTNTLAFSLSPGAPSGAAITPGGAFTWTPTEAQGPGAYPVTIIVTDNGSPVLDDSETFNINVAEVNLTPTLELIGDQSGAEQTLITFDASASDPDLPLNTLAFSLDPGAPAGAAINPVSGLFTWDPPKRKAASCWPPASTPSPCASPTTDRPPWATSRPSPSASPKSTWPPCWPPSATS